MSLKRCTVSPGQDGYFSKEDSLQRGGDGFSGGGGYCHQPDGDCVESYSGGTEGGNGHGSSSVGTFGYGTGEDLGKYRMNRFTISPGGGGGWRRGEWQYGGGGGGVVVNSRDPSL